MPITKDSGALQQFGNRGALSRFESTQRDVAGEFSRLFCRRKREHGFLHLPVKFGQLTVAIPGTDPNYARLSFAWKKSDAASGKVHGRKTGTDGSRGLFQCINLRHRHVAKEFQRDMKLLRSRPADRARRRVALQLALRAADFLSHFRRDRDGDEQAQKRQGCRLVFDLI
jgi:hypothetical protein